MEQPQRILYIDDEEINLINFKHTFEDEYEILTATTGEYALKLLKQVGEVALVITDQRMPGMTGFEVLQNVCEQFPDSVRMVITAYSDVDYLVNAINRGQVYRYLFKPWNELELRTSVKQAVEDFLKTKMKYLVIEKRLSTNWISKLLKGSLINSFWSVFTSHIS